MVQLFWKSVQQFLKKLTTMKRNKLQQAETQDIVELNTVNHLSRFDIYRLLHATTEYTFFSNSHGTTTNTDYILGHKI